MTQQAVLFI